MVSTKAEKPTLMMRMIKNVERAGNKLPHPVYLFLILLAIVLVCSLILSSLGVSVTYLADDGKGAMTETTVSVINLLSRSALQTFLANVITNFSSNGAVHPTVVLMMFMMVADQFGFFEVGLRRLLAGAPKWMATYILSVICICANICAMGGIILAATIGGIFFKAQGRNPVGGILLAWAAVNAGYTACLLPASTDVTLSGITQSFSASYGYTVHALSNWFFMIAATLVLAGITTLIYETFLTKLYPDPVNTAGSADGFLVLKAEEKRGLKWSGYGALVILAVMLVLCVPKNGFFRNADGQLVPKSPLMSGLIIIIGICFLVLGVCYGRGCGTIKKATDVTAAMGKGIASVADLLVVLFFASQFTYAFNASNIGTIISIKGEQFFRSENFVGLPLLIVFAVFCAIVNIFIYSAATKWMLLAPVFVPMLCALNLHPAFIQVAYRIGDSCTNNITPLNMAFPACITLIMKYIDEKEREKIGSGVGTVIAAQIPFSIAFFFTFILLLILFYTLGLPLGPGM